MKPSLYPCLWFDGKAQEAAELYTSLFRNSSIRESNPMVTYFELDGNSFMALNGGPEYQPNASLSFYVTLEDPEELENIWNELMVEGEAFIPLGSYDWSEVYGWVQDRYGVTWQLSLGNVTEVGQSIVPLFMFCGDQQGKAEDVISFYINVFPDSEEGFVARYEPGQVKLDARVVHARFRLNDQLFMAMDSAVPQSFTFNEAISMVISCDTQEEIDHYWHHLTERGQEGVCGWCKDPFGVSWQVVPSMLGQLMSDPEKAPRVGAAFMKMKKMDIETLVNA